MASVKKSEARSPGNSRGKPERKSGARKKGASSSWSLRLYVAGRSPKSQSAFINLKSLCEKHIPGRYSIEVIDLRTNPGLAKVDQIVAIPTLVRKVPPPLKRVIGDLSDSDKAMVALEMAPLGD
jgi:circadian clock protein KaiB